MSGKQKKVKLKIKRLERAAAGKDRQHRGIGPYRKDEREEQFKLLRPHLASAPS